MSYTIGVMIGNANSPHTIETIKGIREAANQSGVNVINFIGVHSSYFCSEYFEKERQEDYDYQSTSVFSYEKLCQLDALIVSYGSMTVFMSEKELNEFKRSIVGTPTVFLENIIEDKNVRYLTDDNYTGMKQIMEHLIKFHGYEKILYLSGPKGNLDADERLRAYTDCMVNSGLLCNKSMIEEGDFSENVKSKVNKLLDTNPDAEALVCANDVMAIAAYEVIKDRAAKYDYALRTGDRDGIDRYKKHKIGEASEYGITVTGYDNISDSGNIDPPLTTVYQSPYSHGFLAVRTALSLIENEKAASSSMAIPKLVCRQSCGCKRGKVSEFPTLDDRFRIYPEHYASAAAEIFTNNTLPVELNDSVSDEVYSEIYNIILKNFKSYVGITGKKLDSDDLLEDVRAFVNGHAARYIPRMTLVTAFNDFMLNILKNAKQPYEREVLIEAQSKISDYLYSKLYGETKNQLMMYRHRTWFMPLISRDMTNSIDSPKEMYRNAITKLNVLELGDVYLFVTDETIVHRKNERWECPKELKLMAFSENGEITSYDPLEAPVISENNFINTYIKGKDDTYNVSLLNLYSGEYQYGVIVARLAPEDALSLYCASVQVSTALNYCEIARNQVKAEKELKLIVKEVEEKNEILRSLSEYDQLTGCFNRRGFMESGIKLIKEHAGEKACVIFADLDHLKEINDKYGHSEGDFAIENMAKNMKSALPDGAILARLGGDEFVALLLLGEGMDEEILLKNISSTSIAFNAISAKPYYIECSAGYKTFLCEENTSLEDVMEEADGFLYEAKGRRRKSIVRSMTIV